MRRRRLRLFSRATKSTVKDGVIDDPRRWHGRSRALVGTAADTCGAITETEARIIKLIWDGPRRQDGSFLWWLAAAPTSRA
jgi:hypothetical protein